MASKKSVKKVEKAPTEAKIDAAITGITTSEVEVVAKPAPKATKPPCVCAACRELAAVRPGQLNR